MPHKLITKRILPIELAELRLHLKLDDPDDVNPLDVLTASRLDAACDFAQHHIGRAIGTQAIEVALGEFPAGSIELPFTPAASVTELTYVDAAGTTQTLASSAYKLDDFSEPALIIPMSAWPDTFDTPNAVRVRYVCGFDADTLPGAIKSAIMLIVGDLHENNQDTSTIQLDSLPRGVKALLDTEKVWR